MEIINWFKKTYPDFKVELLQNISSDSYLIAEDQKPECKILPEKEKIGEYEAQKAETKFGGRTWTAWFSTAILIQDGPYKFHGLPGLILEMEDSTGTHAYKFVGSKKFDDIEKFEKKEEIVDPKPGRTFTRTFSFGFANGKEIEISEEQFKKQWKDYKNDPVKNMRQMLSQGNVKMTVNMNGKQINDSAEMLRVMEKHQKESIKNDNNKIEPALYP